MTPIERACAAIIEALRAQGDLCDDCGEPEYAQVDGSFRVEPLARAVMEAMREPSTDAVRAGWDAMQREGAERPDHHDVFIAYQAMIDAQLSSAER